MKLCPQCTNGYADHVESCPIHGGMLSEIRDLRPGMIVRSAYRIVRKLGQGGMGAVYLADQVFMEEPRALKFLSSELSQDVDFTARFRREVRTLRQVRHKNVVDSGDLEPAEDGTLFFPMEFVDGPDLRSFINAAPKPFDVALALSITRGIAEGLGAAHAKGMVHRDVKPENILMANDGQQWIPKIADFGIVATRELSQHTQTGSLLLTPFYAAPEQWLGTRAADLDGRTDLYALGGVLYEMLTGRKVFEAENYHGWAQQHLTAAPQPPSNLRPDLANWPGLDALILRLLAKERDQRPANVGELIRLLDALVFTVPRVSRATRREETKAAASQESSRKGLKPAQRLEESNRDTDAGHGTDPEHLEMPGTAARISRKAIGSVLSGLAMVAAFFIPRAYTTLTGLPPFFITRLAATLLIGSAGLTAIILGHLSQSEIQKNCGRITGSYIAVSGMILGYIGFVVCFCIFIILHNMYSPSLG